MSKLRKLIGRLYPTVPMRALLKGIFKKSKSGESPPTLNYVGGADFSTGNATLSHLIEVGGLEPDDHVLDVGCGIGRVAVPMTKYLSKAGSYRGFDIVKSGIDWCNENVRVPFPNFQFAHVDAYNLLYNPSGKVQSSDLVFPYPPDSFTFVFANSVFTHMLPENTARYFTEISKVSKAGMRGYLTFYLLTPEILERHEKNMTAHRFPHAFDGYRTLRKHIGKEGVVAYTKELVEKMVKTAGMEISEIRFGSWSYDKTVLGDHKALFQDVVIVKKP